MSKWFMWISIIVCLVLSWMTHDWWTGIIIFMLICIARGVIKMIEIDNGGAT